MSYIPDEVDTEYGYVIPLVTPETRRVAGVKLLTEAMSRREDGWTLIPDGLRVLEMLEIISSPAVPFGVVEGGAA